MSKSLKILLEHLDEVVPKDGSPIQLDAYNGPLSEAQMRTNLRFICDPKNGCGYARHILTTPVHTQRMVGPSFAPMPPEMK